MGRKKRNQRSPSHQSTNSESAFNSRLFHNVILNREEFARRSARYSYNEFITEHCTWCCVLIMEDDV